LYFLTYLLTLAQALASVALTSVADLLLFLRDFHCVIFLEIVQLVVTLRKVQASSQLEITNSKVG
jgi:hypothetical protein